MYQIFQVSRKHIWYIQSKHHRNQVLLLISILFFKFLLQLIYNYVLISGVSKVIRLYIHKDHFFFVRFFSHIGYYRGLSRVPCAIQQVLTSNLFYIFVPTCLVAQSCPTLRDPMNCSLPGSSVHGISQVRILQWIAISCSRGSSPPRD